MRFGEEQHHLAGTAGSNEVRSLKNTLFNR
jgi:hypothetical protein